MEPAEMPGEQPVENGRRVPWGAAEIVFVFVGAMLIQAGVQTLLQQSGWFTFFYGPGWMAKEAAAGRVAQMRVWLWSTCLAFPLQLSFLFAVLYQVFGGGPKDIGLTGRGLPRQVLAGILFSLIFIPGVLAINWLVNEGLMALGSPVEEHPFTRMGQGGLYSIEWVLLVASAVIVAPVWEEVYYRGLVQPWIMDRQPLGGPAALGVALLLTIVFRENHLRTALENGGQTLFLEVLPIVGLGMMGAIYTLLARRNAEHAGLFASAVLFAWVHVSVWPSPVALVWLALGLGWLAWRSRSLVGAIVLHAVFNGVACVMLVLEVMRPLSV